MSFWYCSLISYIVNWARLLLVSLNKDRYNASSVAYSSFLKPVQIKTNMIWVLPRDKVYPWMSCPFKTMLAGSSWLCVRFSISDLSRHEFTLILVVYFSEIQPWCQTYTVCYRLFRFCLPRLQNWGTFFSQSENRSQNDMPHFRCYHLFPPLLSTEWQAWSIAWGVGYEVVQYSILCSRHEVSMV